MILKQIPSVATKAKAKTASNNINNNQRKTASNGKQKPPTFHPVKTKAKDVIPVGFQSQIVETRSVSCLSDIDAMEDHLNRARENLIAMQKANIRLQKSLKDLRPISQGNLQKFVAFFESKIKDIEKTINVIEITNDLKENERPPSNRNDPYVEFQTRELFSRIEALEKTNFDQKILIKRLEASAFSQKKMELALEKLRFDVRQKDHMLERQREDFETQRKTFETQLQTLEEQRKTFEIQLQTLQQQRITFETQQQPLEQQQLYSSHCQTKDIHEMACVTKESEKSDVEGGGKPQSNSNFMPGLTPLSPGETKVDRFIRDLRSIDDEIKRIEAELQNSKEVEI